MEKLTKVVVESNSEIAPGAFITRFRRSFSFKAGQIIGVTVDKQIGTRLYSICSSPTDDLVSILYTVKDDGQLTPKLAEVKPGDSLWITEPTGKFVMQEAKSWWIATGTGIAPFYSMFRTGLRPEKLIQGGRKVHDLYFYSDFKGLPDYVACCSQDSGNISGKVNGLSGFTGTFP